jgi:hypothetical protein
MFRIGGCTSLCSGRVGTETKATYWRWDDLASSRKDIGFDGDGGADGEEYQNN